MIIAGSFRVSLVIIEWGVPIDLGKSLMGCSALLEPSDWLEFSIWNWVQIHPDHDIIMISCHLVLSSTVVL